MEVCCIGTIKGNVECATALCMYVDRYKRMQGTSMFEQILDVDDSVSAEDSREEREGV